MTLMNVCLVIMTAVRTHNALMSKEHMAANVSMVILVTVISVPMSTSVRPVFHRVTSGPFAIIHWDRFIAPANLDSRLIQIKIAST